jgi:hypothetical protein
MKHFILAAAALGQAAVNTTSVFAGEGNGAPFPPAASGTSVVSSPLTVDTGSQAYPAFANTGARVTFGGVLASNGSAGVVQSANSLPSGWADGTATQPYTQPVNRYFAQQQATQMAQVSPAARRGW